MNELVHELAAALRVHHDWSVRNTPGYGEHGAEAVAYRSTTALLEQSERPSMTQYMQEAGAMKQALTDEQMHALSVLLVAASGRTTPLDMEGAQSILRLITEAPNSPWTALPPAAVQAGWTLRSNCGKPDALITDGDPEGEVYCSQVCNEQHDALGCPHELHQGYRHPAEAARLIACEDVLRSIASWLGVGGYNAPEVDAKVFEAKIRDGVAIYSQLHGIAAARLAEVVLAMSLITPKGIRARELARQVLGIAPLAANEGTLTAGKQGGQP